MLDRIVRPWIDPPFDRAGRTIARARLSANAMTLGGFAVGLAVIPAIGVGE